MGPLIHLWIMRYEGKHKYFKKIMTSNFIKYVCKSLRMAHQQMIAVHIKDTNFLNF